MISWSNVKHGNAVNASALEHSLPRMADQNMSLQYLGCLPCQSGMAREVNQPLKKPVGHPLDRKNEDLLQPLQHALALFFTSSSTYSETLTWLEVAGF
jgi:hypothetical protein